MTWAKYWTTPYALTNCILFGRQYTHACWQELGIGFSEVHFVIEKRMATVYRIEEEQETFSTTLGNLFQEQPGKAADIIHQALKIQEELFTLFAEKDIYSWEFFDNFVKKYNTFLPYFLGVAWAANVIDSQKDTELFTALEEVRMKTEHFYSSAEKFFDRYFSFIAEKEHIKNPEILSALTDEELDVCLKEQVMPSTELLQERYLFSLVSVKNGQMTISSGQEAHATFVRIGITNNTVDKNLSELKGQTAEKGHATGKVRIILNHEDADLIESGEILVTAMTRPEWVPAIKKCAAIVTDVGGMLCHAAIVARELKKPCVIGTKVATEIFHNGDMVEVNADTGRITVLSRA